MAWRCFSKKCRKRASVPIKIVGKEAHCFMCNAHLADMSETEIERYTYTPPVRVDEEKEVELCAICEVNEGVRKMYVKPSTGNRWWNMVCLTCEPYKTFGKRVLL
jgi:hypothetical protein